MEYLKSFIIAIFGLCLAIGSSVLYLNYGFGVEPKNWLAIIGFGVLGQLLAQIIIKIAQK